MTQAANPSPAEPFLSVVVPTYNRASELDRQLAWLHRELTSLGVTWEVRVHDNASTDDTSTVCARWRNEFGPDVFHLVRNRTNIGGIPNLSDAVAGARGRWTWSVGDDDVIEDGTTAMLVAELERQPDLAMLFLNYRGVDAATGATMTEHYFDPAMTGRIEDGKDAFAFHAAANLGSVIFLTATVYRTELVHAAQDAWGPKVANWALVAFWAGHVCARGPVVITPDVRIDCVVGASHWQSEHGTWTKAIYDQIPKVFVRLRREGYPADLCRQIGLEPLRESVQWKDWRAHLRAVRFCPACLVTLAMLEMARLEQFT